MQAQEHDNQILQLIEKELLLPSPPAIAIQILNTVQKDDAALIKLAEIISADPVLTAKMLKVANSGIFPCRSKITNIDRAMSMLGTNIIKNIALTFVLAADFSDNKYNGFDFDHFWRYSVTSAVAAETLAKAFQYNNDDIFVTALLQDLGMLVIALTKGIEYEVLLEEAQLPGVTSLTDLEQEKYGYDHQQVSYALLLSWNLPDSISTPILYHHQTEGASEGCQKAAEILHFADQLSAIYNEPGTAEKVRLLQQQLVERFSIDETQALELLDDIATNSSKIIKAFDLDPGEIKPYSMLLQEANSELGKLNLSNEQIILEMKDAGKKAKNLANQLQKANIQLKELAYLDSLTGLYNHRHFQETLTSELSHAARYHSSVSLILLDIDFFKGVNDTYGHLAGDQVLINIAKAITSAVRPSDITARYGGDEFAVIMPETSATGVKIFSSRLRRCIEGNPTLVDGHVVYITVSIGTTTLKPDQPGVTKDFLIKMADRGLYLSKDNGRNQVTNLDLNRCVEESDCLSFKSEV